MANCTAVRCIVLNAAGKCVLVNGDGSCGQEFFINPAAVVCVRTLGQRSCSSATGNRSGQDSIVVVADTLTAVPPASLPTLDEINSLIGPANSLQKPFAGCGT